MRPMALCSGPVQEGPLSFVRKLHNVSEVIDNLFLCAECWSRYVETVIGKAMVLERFVQDVASKAGTGYNKVA